VVDKLLFQAGLVFFLVGQLWILGGYLTPKEDVLIFSLLVGLGWSAMGVINMFLSHRKRSP
jgi:hypothetical protein